MLQNPEAYLPTVAIQAAVAAGDLGAKAEPGLKEALLRLMDSPVADDFYRLSDSALFAFARLAKNDPVAQDVLVQRIASWLEANAGPEETVKALHALANAEAGQANIVSRANDLAGSADENIRDAAQAYLARLQKPAGGAGEQPRSGG